MIVKAAYALILLKGHGLEAVLLEALVNIAAPFDRNLQSAS